MDVLYHSPTRSADATPENAFLYKKAMLAHSPDPPAQRKCIRTFFYGTAMVKEKPLKALKTSVVYLFWSECRDLNPRPLDPQSHKGSFI